MQKKFILPHHLLDINGVIGISRVVRTTQEPTVLVEEGMEIEKEGLKGGYRAAGGSSKGGRKEVDIWLHVLSWTLHLNVRCDWNGLELLERTDPGVMWFI